MMQPHKDRNPQRVGGYQQPLTFLSPEFPDPKLSQGGGREGLRPGTWVSTMGP